MPELQSTLFDLPPINKVEYAPEMTLRERWWAFHCQNLFVYDTLRAMALELRGQGFNQCGIALLWERLRWERYIATQGQDEYKLSNSYRAFYSRFLMVREPELIGFFRIKSQPTELDDDTL